MSKSEKKQSAKMKAGVLSPSHSPHSQHPKKRATITILELDKILSDVKSSKYLFQKEISDDKLVLIDTATISKNVQLLLIEMIL